MIGETDSHSLTHIWEGCELEQLRKLPHASRTQAPSLWHFNGCSEAVGAAWDARGGRMLIFGYAGFIQSCE